MRFFWITLLFFASVFSFQISYAQKKRFLTIGTGGVTGVYYPTGGALCDYLNKIDSLNVRCNVEATGGSEYNVNMITAGELDMGIVQSDVGYKAWMGEQPFSNKSENLRSVFSVHAESVTLVTRRDANIRAITDMKNKRINLGNPGSGQFRTSMDLLNSCAMTSSDLKLSGTLKAAEMPDALRDQKLDGYFYVVGHPTANIKDISTTTDIRITPLTGICVNNLVESKPYFVRTIIPKGLYRGQDEDVATFGVKATLLASERVPEDIVYNLVKKVFENLDQFKTLHPAYKEITQKSMLEGLSAPFHPGAKKYFQEKGLL